MSPEGAIQKSMIAMVCVAPAGVPFYSDPYRGFAALTPGYALAPLQGAFRISSFERYCPQSHVCPGVSAYARGYPGAGASRLIASRTITDGSSAENAVPW